MLKRRFRRSKPFGPTNANIGEIESKGTACSTESAVIAKKRLPTFMLGSVLHTEERLRSLPAQRSDMSRTRDGHSLDL